MSRVARPENDYPDLIRRPSKTPVVPRSLCERSTMPRAGSAASLLVLLAACSAPANQPPQATADVTVFEGALLITGEDGPPIENSAFIVENFCFLRSITSANRRPPRSCRLGRRPPQAAGAGGPFVSRWAPVPPQDIAAFRITPGKTTPSLFLSSPRPSPGASRDSVPSWTRRNPADRD